MMLKLRQLEQNILANGRVDGDELESCAGSYTLVARSTGRRQTS
jgi:hypothetical protein